MPHSRGRGDRETVNGMGGCMNQPTTVREVLIAAKELISTPERWTQNAFARGMDGLQVPLDTGAACQWCIAGAMIKVSNLTERRIYGLASRVLAGETSCGVVTHYNDAPERTHAEVMELFDRAINQCEKEQP